VAKKLADDRLGLYASRRYLDAHGTPANLSDLATHRRGFAVHRVAGLHTAEFLKEWRSSVAVSLKMGQIEAVRAGAGIGILHAFMAKRDASLVPVLPAHQLTRSYWTVIHENLRSIRRITLALRSVRLSIDRLPVRG
jgi:DNA-binding transcriptional LysR family regulator